MKTFGYVVTLVSLAAGCGSDDDAGTCEDDGGAACFELPTAPMVAHAVNGTMSPPLLACAKLQTTTSAISVDISGTLKGYTSGTGIANAMIEVFTSTTFTSPIVTLTSASDGAINYTLPAGTPDILHLKVSGAGLLDGYAYHQLFKLDMPTITMVDYRAPTGALIDVVESTTRVDQAAGKDVIAAAVLDCEGKPIEHAIVTVSSTSGKATHVPGISVFYTPPGSFPVPVARSERIDTNTNGAVGILNVPSGTAYVQGWGFKDAAAVAKGKAGLTLIAEWPATAFGDAVLAVPLRGSVAP